MSVQNGERFIRLLKEDSELRERVRAVGPDGFEVLSAESGASCTTYEVVSAFVREMERGES